MATMNEPLRAIGAGRMADNERAAIVHFNRRLTDDELRALHDMLRDAASALADPRECDVMVVDGGVTRPMLDPQAPWEFTKTPAGNDAVLAEHEGATPD